MQPETIPLELKESRRYVLWRWQWTERKKKWTKPPLQANGRAASATDPSTWIVFEEALAVYLRGGFDGIGLVLTKKDGLTGIDLDDCRDPNTGVIEPWAVEVVTTIQSYAELSPSGTGIRIWLKGELPPHGRKKGSVEVYDDLRFLTLTGHALADTVMTIECRQDELLIFHRQVFGERQPVPDVRANLEPISLQVPDGELLERARAARNGMEFAALFDRGDLSRHDGDHSRADLALCCSLCFWTNGDAAAIERLFRRSALMRPKWDERHFGDGRTYGQATVAKAQELVREGWRPAVAEPSTTRSGRDGQDGHEAAPVIVCTDRGLHDLEGQQGTADEALQALVSANRERSALFVRDRELVRVVHSKTNPDDSGHPLIEPLSRDALTSELARSAWFVTVGSRGRLQHINPPEVIVRAIFARASWDGLPSLAGVTETPVVRSDGTILKQPGYDPATWLYYAPQAGFRLPPMPDRPDANDVGRAVELLNEAFCDFPFADASSRANAYALLLTPFVRNLIGEGLVPLAVIDATTPGTGKGLLLDLTTVISTGSLVPKRSPARDGDEWRKELFAAALEGANYFVIDNAAEPLGAAALDSAITAGRITSRILGESRQGVAAIRWTWVATGNNIVVRGDLARRCYWIRMVSPVADPSKRTDFRHPELLPWAQENRAHLIAAVLTLVRAWFVAGQPRAETPAFGSFERWTKTVGGILGHSRIEGFLTNLDGFRKRADRGRDEWETFIAAWWTLLRRAEVTIGELTRRLLEDQAYVLLRDAVPGSLSRQFDRARGESSRGFATALGRALTEIEGRRFGEPALMFVKSTDVRGKLTTWRLVDPDTTGSSIGPIAGPARPPSGGLGSSESTKPTRCATPANRGETGPAGPAGPANGQVSAQGGYQDSCGSAGPAPEVRQRSGSLHGPISSSNTEVAGPAGPAGPLSPRGSADVGAHGYARRRTRMGLEGPAGPAGPADQGGTPDQAGDRDELPRPAGGLDNDSAGDGEGSDDWEVWRP